MPSAAKTAAKTISRNASLEPTAPRRALTCPLLARSGENGRRLRVHQVDVDQRRRGQVDPRRQRAKRGQLGRQSRPLIAARHLAEEYREAPDGAPGQRLLGL